MSKITLKDLYTARNTMEQRIQDCIRKEVEIFTKATGADVKKIRIDQEAIPYILSEPHRCLDLVTIKIDI